jgi:hypothetical protein
MAKYVIGHPMLLIGTSEGVIYVRSCVSMNLMFCLDRKSICHQNTVTGLVGLGNSHFASVSDDGQIMLWQVTEALLDKSLA